MSIRADRRWRDKHMQVMRTATAAILLLGLAATASAQEGTPAPRPAPAEIRIDVSRLPLDLQRIQRELQQSAITAEDRDGLNLRYQIEVYGRAPQIQLFTAEDNLTTGPVPYGAPTHREVIEHITPQEFRSPVMDFNSLFRWLAEKAKK
jgi:hypothetical protein